MTKRIKGHERVKLAEYERLRSQSKGIAATMPYHYRNLPDGTERTTKRSGQSFWVRRCHLCGEAWTSWKRPVPQFHATCFNCRKKETDEIAAAVRAVESRRGKALAAARQLHFKQKMKGAKHG